MTTVIRCTPQMEQTLRISFKGAVSGPQAMIMPGVRVGHGDGGPGCFTPTHEPAVTNWQLFGWEVRDLSMGGSVIVLLRLRSVSARYCAELLYTCCRVKYA